MLIEIAEVVAYRKGIAQVRCSTKQGCQSCVAQRSCGAAALSQLNGSKNDGELIFWVNVDRPLEIGQKIEIGLEERVMILSAMLLYIIPLSILIISSLLSAKWFEQEWVQGGIIALSTAVSFFIVRLISPYLEEKKQFQPHFIRVIGETIPLADTKYY